MSTPQVVWFHGGGLLQGSRDLLAPHFRRGVQKYGFACVAADYRLVPQVGISEVLEDALDCLRFVRSELSSHLEQDTLDVKRVAVSGNSAGGYLALLAGLYAEPKPKVIIPLEPITDPLGGFFITPQPIPPEYYLATHAELAEYLDASAESVSRSGWVPDDPRANMYVRMLKDANLAELLHMGDSLAGQKFRVGKQVHKNRLPPAYFLHGDADIDVGVDQSDEVVGAMLGCRLDVQYERAHGKAHYLANGPEYENEALYAFLMQHL